MKEIPSSIRTTLSALSRFDHGPSSFPVFDSGMQASVRTALARRRRGDVSVDDMGRLCFESSEGIAWEALRDLTHDVLSAAVEQE